MTTPYTTPDALWQAALDELRLQMTRAAYDTWLGGSHALLPASSDQQLVVAVRSLYAPAWLTQRLGKMIQTTLAELAGRPVTVTYVTTDGAPAGGSVQPDHPILSIPINQQGESPMSNQSQSPQTVPAANGQTRVRLYSHVTQSRFLHIEDSLQIGKLRFFAGTYKRNQGMADHCHHFLDIPDARVIFAALAAGRGEFNHKEYKGTPPVNGRSAVSRVFSVTAKGESVYIELKSGPGKLTDTGAILPAGQPTTAVNVSFKRYEAQRMAVSVLAYLRAWDTVRMLAHQELVGAPPAYLLVPTVSEAELAAAAATSTTTTANGRNGQKSQPVAKKTAVSDPAQPAANGNGRANAQSVVGPVGLMYGDGTAVDQGNRTEVETFQSYLAAKQAAPDSKGALLAYYRKVLG
jgi:hypothetical protein